MKITLNGKSAILFARVWGVIAILFGLFILATIIDSLVRQGFSSYMLLTIIFRLVFSALFIIAGRFFLQAKMSV